MKKALILIITLILLGIIISIYIFTEHRTALQVDNRIKREGFGMVEKKGINKKLNAIVYEDPIDKVNLSALHYGLIDIRYLLIDNVVYVVQWDKEQIRRFDMFKVPGKIYFKHIGQYIRVEDPKNVSNYLVVNITLPQDLYPPPKPSPAIKTSPKEK